MSRHDSLMDINERVADSEGPSLISEDPNERKLARRQRIERRIQAVNYQQTIDMGQSIEEEKEPIVIQMEKSAAVLETFLKESKEYLENIKVANEAREIERKQTEGIGRAEVMSQLQAEAIEAQAQYNEITGKWAGIQEYKDPLHINEDMLDLKIKCDELIQQKDEIIEMLRKELKIAERKFTTDQTKQNLDIQILSQRIEKQINFMKNAYNAEFTLIDQVISAEKRKFINKSNQKWEDLAQKRTQEETTISENMFRHQEEMSQNIQKLSEYYEDLFRQTKIQLELDIQNSQNEFENIKYLTLSNSEKLDYNYQTLKRRENENIIIKNQQKRRISKLQDAISELKSTLRDYRENMTKQINRTRQNILKIRTNILDIEAKGDLLAVVNEKKFNDIWDMNSEECFVLLEKIIGIDKILHEQQMGVKWHRPVIQKIEKTLMPSYQQRLNMKLTTSPYKHSLHVESQHQNSSKASANVTKNLLADKIVNVEINLNYKRLRYILTKLSNKSGFLTEKCLKQILNNYEDNERTLVTLNNVFIGLDIKKSEDIDLMIDFFLPYCYCPICTDGLSGRGSSVIISTGLTPLSSASSQGKIEKFNYSIAQLDEAWDATQQTDTLIEDIVLEVVQRENLIDKRGLLNIELPDAKSSDHYNQTEQLGERLSFRRKQQRQESDKMSCRNHNHPLVLSTVYVLTALRDFVTNYHKEVFARPTLSERLVKKRDTTSRLLEDDDIISYWHNFINIYNESNIEVWNSLCEGLMKYLEVLKERQKASEEVVALRKRNNQLKRLLADYMDHGELMRPICLLQTEFIPQCSIPPYSDHK